MSLLLGVDTGGTYTDAVLMEGERRVIAAAKALTTRHDLSLGIGAAIEQVLAEAGVPGSAVRLASLSTTLATNALVEGHGEPAALVAIGFDAADLARQGLEAALGSDPLICLPGGHDHSGHEIAPLDTDALAAQVARVAPHVAAVAVAARFATRNPAHEQAARAAIRAATGLPVTLSSELSARLGGPRRALTALLNARLIGLIDRLIAACESRLAALGIDAPLMVVRGDAALVSAAFARERPIETILSGPAASLVGAGWATGLADAVIADIGGTTTDIAVLEGGRPRIDAEGAQVGGMRTMVEAVAMRTIGLGGDSEVHVGGAAGSPALRLGPRRVMPVALAAHLHGEAVLGPLARQLEAERPGAQDARFVVRTGLAPRAPLQGREERLYARLVEAGGIAPVGAVVTGRIEASALDRLIARGLVMGVGLTPSDAAHVLGHADAWSRPAAEMALALLARRRDGMGNRLAAGPDEMAQAIADALTRQSAEAILAAALARDLSGTPGVDAEAMARSPLAAAALDGAGRVSRLSVGLSWPLIGLGASAPVWYPAVAARLGTQAAIPEHAGVANAIGAVVGRVSVTERAGVTAQGEGRFRAHLPDGPRDFAEETAALDALEAALRARATQRAAEAGAAAIAVEVDRRIEASTVEGRRVFVSAEISVTAAGRPRLG